MDSRAKQRLTGAVILVALFVLLVPELLTGPSSKQSTTSNGQDGLREYTIDLDAPQQTNDAATDEPIAEVTLPVAATSTHAAPNEGEGKAIPTPVATTTGSTPTTSPPTPPANSRPSVAPVNALPSHADSQRAVQTPRVAESQPQTTESSRFAVQLGSFGNRENADRLVSEMKAKGFSAFVAPITSGGRELFRVRVGPARDRAD